MSEKVVVTPISVQSSRMLLCGRIKDGRLIEARLDYMPGESSLTADNSFKSPTVGDIFIGKVQRVLTSLNAAFVEVAPGFPCYLPLDRVTDPVFALSSSRGSVVSGDEIVVQVCRDAVQSKSPTLSTNLNFAGRFVILTTENKKLGLSSKFDGAAHDHFKNLLSDHMPDNCGLIVRTNAQRASDEDVIGEINVLSEQMRKVVSAAATHTCFSCLYRHKSSYISYLMGTYTEGLDEIVTDIPSVYKELEELCGRYSDLSDIPLNLYEDDLPLVSLYNLNREMVRATSKEVRLKSGGYLVIEPTEAMTVIDVNSGKSISKKDRSDHLFRVNMEASREIARQLRLRNISGIVVVDYIDLDTAGQRRELMEELRRLVRSDPVPVQVHDITALNLVEITRKKVEKSLYERIKQLTIKNAL